MKTTQQTIIDYLRGLDEVYPVEGESTCKATKNKWEPGTDHHNRRMRLCAWLADELERKWR